MTREELIKMHMDHFAPLLKMLKENITHEECVLFIFAQQTGYDPYYNFLRQPETALPVFDKYVRTLKAFDATQPNVEDN